jgi:hypothetical protein
VVGDRGPGGGIVYYVSAAAFTSTGSSCNTSCRYLEVAPATWKTGAVANDERYVWQTLPVAVTGQDLSATTESEFTAEAVNWKIGQGFNNTRLMNVGGSASDARTAVLAYAGNSIAGQWFIPSMNELNELCKFARGQTTGVLTRQCDHSGTLKTGIANDLGGFVGQDYMSSSEYFLTNVAVQGFGTGGQGHGLKAATWNVRPVRAF